jgi:hypothetical protein
VPFVVGQRHWDGFHYLMMMMLMSGNEGEGRFGGQTTGARGNWKENI